MTQASTAVEGAWAAEMSISALARMYGSAVKDGADDEAHKYICLLDDMAKKLEDEINRRKGDPHTRLHNLCEAISEEADRSEFSREEWNRIDAENAALRASNAQQLAALKELVRIRDWAVLAGGCNGPLPQDVIQKFAEQQIHAMDAARAAIAGAPSTPTAQG